MAACNRTRAVGDCSLGAVHDSVTVSHGPNEPGGYARAAKAGTAPPNGAVRCAAHPPWSRDAHEPPRGT